MTHPRWLTWLFVALLALGMPGEILAATQGTPTLDNTASTSATPPGGHVALGDFWLWALKSIRDGYPESILKAIDPTSGDTLWTFYEEYDSTIAAVVGDTCILQTQDGALIAFSPTSVDPVWTWQDGWVTSAISASATQLHVLAQPTETAYDQKRMIAIDAQTGVERWRYPETIGQSPLSQYGYAAGNLVLVLLQDAITYDDKVLVALDAVTGERRWIASVPGTSLWVSGADAELIYTKDIDYLYALDRETGDERWRVRIGVGTIAVGGRFLASDGDLVAVALDDETTAPPPPSGADWSGRQDARLRTITLLGLDLATGAERWRYPVGETPLRNSVTALFAGGLLYVVAGDGFTVALDAATGAERWRGTGAEDTHVSALADGLLVTSSYGELGFLVEVPSRVIALDAATGADRWDYRPGDYLLDEVNVRDGRVFVMAAYADLAALDLATGDILWRHHDF